MLELITDCSITLLVVSIYTKETPRICYYLPKIHRFGFSNFDNYNVGLIENKGIEIVQGGSSC
jgi:hypothetical protein